MKSFLVRSLFSAALLAGAGIPVTAGTTPEEAAAGRRLLERYADAVIGVELVAALTGTVGDRPFSQERKIEANGTVIAPSGLTVVSIGSLDPRIANPPPPNARIEEPEFKEVKLRTADGTEYPARVVLKDEDLDLAFIAPEPAVAGSLPPFVHVSLDDPAKAEILGNYYDLSRANKRVQRAPAIRIVNVIAIVEKPRRLLLATEYSFGCPVFDREGRLLGVTLRHVVDGRAIGSTILPAAEIAEIVPPQP